MFLGNVSNEPIENITYDKLSQAKNKDFFNKSQNTQKLSKTDTKRFQRKPKPDTFQNWSKHLHTIIVLEKIF